MLLLLSLAGPSSASPGWAQKAPTPAAGGYGEAAVGTGSFVYVVRCYSTASAVQFWRYDPSSDSWSSLSAAGLASGTFRNGTALAWDGGDCIYALAGARYEDPDRRLFLRYRISTDAWEQLENTPGPQGAGDALAWSGWDNRLYALLGSSQHGTVFARWSPSSGWEVLASPPGGVDDGASLAWAGGRYLFALRGEYYESSPLRDFWCYDIEAGSWSSRSPIPDPGGVGDGGSLLWIGGFRPEEADHLYALGGGSFDENGGYGFFRYRISADTWEELEDLPFPVGYYNGSRLAFAGDAVYCWQGTPSTWPGGGNAFYAWTVSAPTNNPPSLSSGSVSPSSGGPTTAFAYEVTYSDPDGDPPAYVRVCVDGTAYAMSYVSGTYSGGALYRYQATLPAGSHTYYFEASDGKVSVKLPSTGAYSGPTVTAANNSPTLSSGSVSPSSGAPGTTFAYEVTYADPDGDAPAYVRVCIDGTEHAMARVSGTYVGGALYRYSTTLPPGSHTYYFTASDNRGATARLPAEGSLSGPAVVAPNTPPTASFEYSPLSPTVDNLVRFTDLSRDPDGSIVSWLWDFGDNGTSTERNPAHRYSRPGTYTVRLTVTDNGGATGRTQLTLTVWPSPAPSFQVVLTFRRPDGGPLANAAVYGGPEGEESRYLGTRLLGQAHPHAFGY